MLASAPALGSQSRQPLLSRRTHGCNLVQIHTWCLMEMNNVWTVAVYRCGKKRVLTLGEMLWVVR